MSTLSFFSWNPDGFLRFVNNFSVIEMLNKHDFVAIYETWCENRQNIENVLENFHCFTIEAKRKSKHGRASGGIGLYIKKILLMELNGFAMTLI